MRQVSGIHHDWLIGLPLLAEVPGIGWVAVTEADIDHYAGMYLRKDKPAFGLCAELSPRLDQPGIAVEDRGPRHHSLARADDRRRAGAPDRIEHRSESESAVEDRGYVVDQARESRRGTGGPVRLRQA